MARKKRSYSSARFGPRYGVRGRRRVAAIEREKRFSCPSCGSMSVKRISTGIFMCKRCGIKFAGGAYHPRTGVV
jgi:large subunit ribosomal protein L37Ae